MTLFCMQSDPNTCKRKARCAFIVLYCDWQLENMEHENIKQGIIRQGITGNGWACNHKQEIIIYWVGNYIVLMCLPAICQSCFRPLLFGSNNHS
jgi:hypothetical protein